MKSRKPSPSDPDGDAGVAQPNLQTMSDLYCFDLSALLQTMESAGLISSQDDAGETVFRIPICAEHRLAILPICLLCDELSRS